MYSNDKKNGFSILDIIVKIIFAGLFIFILVWLFQKKVPNMKPFYSNVFRENIKYMQEAGESYFTDDKMPKEAGNSVKISLSEMIDKKLIIPFVDEDGNACNENESYVSITKEIDESYSLKTNLVCNKESDYTIKVLGCHNYCKNNDCSKTCSIEKITKYQYKKLISGTSAKYSCPSQYTLKGKECYKTTTDQKKATEIVIPTNTTLTQDAKLIVTGGSKVLIDTIVTNSKNYVDKVETINRTYVARNEKKVPATYTTKTETYACNKTQRKCSTTYKTYTYSCNCSSHFGPNGGLITSCSTCTGTTPVESCKNVNVASTCTKEVTVEATPARTEYSCPAGTTAEGSGINLKCYTESKTYSCKKGSFAEGSGASLKCYTESKTYSCPSTANAQEGSGASLKCYKVTSGTTSYECTDKSYTLDGSKCYKKVIDSKKSLTCPNGYKLSNNVCKKSVTTKKKATAKKTTYKYYTYKWSTDSLLKGWTKTGKTKTEKGKEICK